MEREPSLSSPNEFVFAPDSAMWKIVRHRSILLTGPAAAVLQIAHPRVGLGVMEHSRFADSPLGRLQRTLVAVNTIAFGTRDEAEAAARRVARRHRTVTGDAAAHDVPGPARYSVDELDLLMWVVATLVWSAVGGYERIVAPLTDEEKENFYRDMRVFGTFFALPREYGPQTYREYLAYFDGVIQDELIGSHEVSRRVAWAVARPRTPWWLRLAGGPITFIFSEIIPPPVRDRLGFRSTRFSRLALRAATFSLRLFERIAPDVLRFDPHYRRARKRRNLALSPATFAR
jgi:uncharacterized protein (DUF2236 family)